MEIYLDNSATTKAFDSVIHMVAKTMQEDYGNPSSMHRKGVEAEKYIKYAKDVIARNLKINEKEIIFTSGGTESDNLALIGCALANYRAGKHLITTRIEHPAIAQTMQYLETQGFEVTYLSVDKKGVISLRELEQSIRPDTILVSIMYANNEVGSLQPVEEASRIVKRHNPHCLFHVDAVQGYGKYRIYPKRQGIDLLSVSSHKIHGPKGVGFLYVNEKVKILPIAFGGGQQKGMRSGTENVPGIAGMARAIEEVYRDLDTEVEMLYELKERFIQGISAIEQVQVNGPAAREGAPHIVSVSVWGVRSEVLLHALEDRGIYISAGSACSAHKTTASATLQAMGIQKELLDSTVRFSFSVFTTMEEIEYTIHAMREIIPQLRRYTRH